MPAKKISAPKYKIVLLWVFLVCCIFGSILFGLWRSGQTSAPDETPGFAHSIVMLVLGGFFFTVGALGYLIILLTQCVTFNFSRPVWKTIKVKQFFVNLFFPPMAFLGIGFIMSAFFTPLLARFDLPGNLPFMLPAFGTFGLLQLCSIWVLIWAPLEKRIINHRLAALGVAPEQRHGGLYIGLSNPAVTNSAKRWFAIEEDIGMLWFTPGQMIYWGDVEQFAITRSQLIQVERKADTKSVTMLSGTTHVILHLQLPDGEVRQIRLHTEGVWTMGGKRRASDELDDRINAWLPAAPVQPPAA